MATESARRTLTPSKATLIDANERSATSTMSELRRRGHGRPGTLAVASHPSLRRSRPLSAGRHTRDDAGFGLVEVVISLVVLMVALLPLDFLMTNIAKQSALARYRIAALGVAEHWLSYYNNLNLSAANFANLIGTTTQPPTKIGSATYDSTVTMQWGQVGVNGDLCATGSVPQIINANVVVTWGRGNSVQESTVINPPYGLITPGDGFIAIQVLKADGSNQQIAPPGQPIDVSFSPSTGIVGTPPTVVPATTGCIFVEASVGTYQVTLSSPTPSPTSFVNDGETVTTTVPVAVTSEAVNPIPIAYDQGGFVNITYPSETAVSDGVVCPLDSVCFTMGRSQSGAVVLEDRDGTWTSLPLPAGVDSVTGIGCISGDRCVLTGSSGGSGIVLGYVNGTVSQLTLPSGVTATRVSGVTCPPGAEQCLVTGTNAYGAGILLATDGKNISNVLPATGATTVTALTGSSCLGQNNCIVVGDGTTTPTGSTKPTATGVVLVDNGGTWTMGTVPATVTSIHSVSCSDGGGSPMCTAAASASGPVLLSSTDGGATWNLPTTAPTVDRIDAIACTGSQGCVAGIEQVSGSTTTAAVLVTSDGGSTWTSASSFPSTATAISAVSCPSSTACFAAGDTSAGAFVATSVDGGSTWTSQTLPVAASFASGIACASASNCTAAGETLSGPVVFTTTDGGTTWTSASASAPNGIGGLTGNGLIATGLPLTYGNDSLTTTNSTEVADPYVSATTADPIQVPNLFPFSGSTVSPYAFWAGDCPAFQPAVTDLSASTTYVTAGNSASATLPLTYLALRITDQNGHPISGATVTATVTTASCPGDTFDLPPSQADGTVEVAMPAEGTNGISYNITATAPNSTAASTVAVTATGSNVVDNTTSVTYPAPIPLPITVTLP